MKKEGKKKIALIQLIIDAALKRQLYAIAAFAESFPTFVISVLTIFSVFNLPLAYQELMFWLRSVLSVLMFLLWAITFYQAYKNAKSNVL